MKPKYEIGQNIYWVESSTSYCKKIPCPMCFGKRCVEIVLGNGIKETIECGFCSHGFEYATGMTTTWEPYAEIKSGEIKGIRKDDIWKYEVLNNSVKENQIYLSKEDATPELEKQFKDANERAKKYFIESFINAKKKQVWSLGYHKNQIKQHEKSIEWHKLRLGMITGKL